MDFDIKLIVATIPVVLLLIWDFYLLGRLIFRMLTPVRNSVEELESRSDIKITVPKQRSLGYRLIKRGSNLAWIARVPIIHLTVVAFSTGLMFNAYSQVPRIEQSYPNWEGRWEDYSKPITLYFNVPVQVSSLKPFLSDSELKGSWEYEPYLGISQITRVARFYPDTTLPPNRRLVVYMTGIKRMFVNEYHEGPLNMFTHQNPEVDMTLPRYDQEQVETDTSIVFALNKPNQGLAEWRVEVEPEFDYVLTKPDDETFILTPTDRLAQTETYKVELYRTPVSKVIDSKEILDQEEEELAHRLVFSTVRAPLIDKISPTGTGVFPEEIISIEFEVDMDQGDVEEKILIEPEIEATIEWMDERHIIIDPIEDLPKDTKYTISFPPGLKSNAGGVSEQEIRYSFTTIGPVKVLSFSPRNNQFRVLRNSNIQIKFDQQVDKASAQSKFSISPKVSGKFSWNENTMIFNPTKDFNFNTTYTVRVSPGVKTVYGLDSSQSFVAKFKTLPNITIIKGFGAGTWDRQDYNFSCGVAVMKMALSWKGRQTSEYDLIYNRLGVNSSKMSCTGGACYWGDPNQNFLGQPNGSGTYGTGQSAYGVHWYPVKRVIESYGIKTQLRRGWNVKGLAGEINKGNPVQIWWWNGVSSCYGSSVSGGTRIDWYTSDGNRVEAICGMHSVLVVGFKGDPNNPTAFVVQDPWWGYQTYPVSMFYRQWPKLNNTGLIIY